MSLSWQSDTFQVQFDHACVIMFLWGEKKPLYMNILVYCFLAQIYALQKKDVDPPIHNGIMERYNAPENDLPITSKLNFK